jgi:ATP-dependent 26S proteasome regulatory subunit
MRLSAQASRTVSIHSLSVHLIIDSVGTVRFSLKDLEKDYAKTEDDIKAVQSVGQIIGEVMKQLDDERCKWRESCISSCGAETII